MTCDRPVCPGVRAGMLGPEKVFIASRDHIPGPVLPAGLSGLSRTPTWPRNSDVLHSPSHRLA